LKYLQTQQDYKRGREKAVITIKQETKMVVLVQASVLTVGLNGKSEVLRELPIRLITMQSAVEAARSLKNEKIDSVISKWDLDDMEDGRFLRNLRAVKPEMPTIAFVTAGNQTQEIEARSLGVSAVLTDETDDGLFKETVANLLGLVDIASIKSISPVEKRSRVKTRIAR
jgi:CheY-like chemotaxis protein